MKNRILLLIVAIFITSYAISQENPTVPSVDLKTLEGQTINTSSFSNDGNFYLISFWATWCKPCRKELSAIAEYYDDWQEETGIKLIAVSTDDSRGVSQVGAIVNSSGWEYEIYLDTNGDFKRAMNVNTIPHMFIINGQNEIVWQHNSYTEGDEILLYETILQLIAGLETGAE
jgi:cytochrome c biogenesis protein CcmG, thiol:disulfide interchange protein DsbE